MQIRTLPTFALAGAVGVLAFFGSQALSQEQPQEPESPAKQPEPPAKAPESPAKKPFSADYRDHDPQESQARWAATMQPGPQHAELERFIGEWDMKFTYKMPGMENMPPVAGTTKTRWLFEGKWIISETETSMMGMPMKMAMITGYDNFKRKYVQAQFNSLETEMRTATGNFGAKGENLFMFGTMNEAMTGEVDKPWRFVMRLKSADEHVIEVHDPAIGDGDTQVMTFTYTRKKQ